MNFGDTVQPVVDCHSLGSVLFKSRIARKTTSTFTSRTGMTDARRGGAVRIGNSLQVRGG